MNLQRALLDYDAVLLTAIAGRRGIELETTRPQEMVEALAPALLAPESVQEVTAWLTPRQRAALDALVVAGGRLPAARYAREHGTVRRMGPGRLDREKPWRDPQNPAEALYYAGLVFFGFDELDDEIAEFAFIPDSLLPLLPPAQIDAPELAVTAAPPPQNVRDAGRAFAEDLTTLLAFVQTESPRVQDDGSLRPQDLARLNARLIEPQLTSDAGKPEASGRLGLLTHLARSIKLTQTSERELRLHRPTAREWLKADPPCQMLALQEAWRDDPAWNDLWHVPSLRPERTGGWQNDPPATRARLLAHLSRCSPESWIDLAAFIDAVKRVDPDFQRPPDAYNTWYIRSAASGEYLTGFEHWDQVEGALVTFLVTGPLHWLGVTALGFEGEDEPATAFRLTPGGAAFLGLIDAPPQTSPLPPMSAGADLTVRVLAGGSLFDRFQLARVAEWQSSGDLFVYRVTQASLARALNQGIRSDQIAAFLRRVTGDQLPAQAAETLRRWAGQHRPVRLTRAVLLEVPTAALMRQLRAHPDIGPLLGEPLSPTRALVDERHWKELCAWLQEAGYLPS
jgi:hypothetical protein